MAVDVQTEIEIARPRPEIAGYAADPDNTDERLVMSTAQGSFPMETT